MARLLSDYAELPYINPDRGISRTQRIALRGQAAATHEQLIKKYKEQLHEQNTQAEVSSPHEGKETGSGS